MVPEKRSQSIVKTESRSSYREAGCLYALITDEHSVSRRNRASWSLKQLNEVVQCDPVRKVVEVEQSTDRLSTSKESTKSTESEVTDIQLVSITSLGTNFAIESSDESHHKINDQRFIVTPHTRVLFLSKSIATSIILDLSPSIVSVSPQNDCVFLDSMFDALTRILHLLVKTHEIPSSTDGLPFILEPRVFVSVIAYTPFVAAKSNQVLVQNRRISYQNIEQVLVEIGIYLRRIIQEIHELVSNTCGINLDFDAKKTNSNVFTFPHSNNFGVIRHPGEVLEDIYELGLFSSSLMPRKSRLSVITITDGLIASSNNLNVFRLKSIAISFVSLGSEAAYPDACLGYTPYIDLMKFIAKSTQGLYLSHQDLMDSSHSLSKARQVYLLDNPLYKLFSSTIHSDIGEDQLCYTPRATNFYKFDTATELNRISSSHVSRFFCIDQPTDPDQPSMGNKTLNSYGATSNNNHHDWKMLKQLDRNLDADFEQVLSCLLREGYLIKSVQFKHKETLKIVARLVLHVRHNLDLEQELTASYWSQTEPYDMSDNNQLILRSLNNQPIYGNTHCGLFVHGSYSFLHNLYHSDRRSKRRSEFRELAYRQYRQIIDNVLQTHERLKYLSRFYRESTLSKVPSFLLHGNSLLYEQPHTHKLTSMIENVMDDSRNNANFQEYWQKISCLDTRSWKNLMHIHTLRLVLEHDQPKHKNIHCQNANGRYTQVQCRRALSAISTFIKSYSSFSLLEDTTYIKFIYNKDDDLREIETSATKGFVVIRINKLLPLIVIHLMFTSGILDSNRLQIVKYLEKQLVNCKLRSVRALSSGQMDNILKSKTIYPSKESCCILIKSPLERMLKVYSRNFVTEFLIYNWAHGLPGFCPFNAQQSIKVSGSNNESSGPSRNSRLEGLRDSTKGYKLDDSVCRYNLIFGRYLYGVRTIQTIVNLPHNVVPSLAANVLSKISAILVNIRIKQGFHIAFNKSGILNLVVELSMDDRSTHGNHASSCLVQYLVLPPTVTNCAQNMHSVLSNPSGVSSQPESLSGSLGNVENYMTNTSDSSAHIKSHKDEIKMVKEYWIEQQYGISSPSTAYNQSLNNMRYPEIVDHLFQTDSSIFECLLTYELLQLLCDKLSLYYELDSTLSHDEPKTTPTLSPTTSTTSANLIEPTGSNTSPNLPSTLIEGVSRDGMAKVPLLESQYRFSITKFLDYCQEATLDVLLFRDHSEFFESNMEDLETMHQSMMMANNISDNHSPNLEFEKTLQSRKMSVDNNEFETDTKREHRCSYQQESLNAMSYTTSYINPIYSPSLNHMFLDTLHKRLKQMHDKELKLSEQDCKVLPLYLKKRKLISEQKQEAACHESLNSLNQKLNPDFEEMPEDCYDKEEPMEFRCFLRKGNQDNLMIVLTPLTLTDVNKWLNLVNDAGDSTNRYKYDPICPIFVFRCSSTMINDHIQEFLRIDDTSSCKPALESDLFLHFGQPCTYGGQLKTLNDELSNEISPLSRCGSSNQTTTSDEKTLEVVHFRAFLTKLKNTVLKSRFSSLNDAYLSELFIHKDDILYYMNNVDSEIQKKYHVSSQLKSLADFIKSYQEYNDSLPKEPGKPCNPLLNSILLQKCGLFINQPIARFNDANPMMKQLHDKKLLYLMRCNYKIDLPIIEENLAGSVLLKSYIKSSSSNCSSQTNNQSSTINSIPMLSSSNNETFIASNASTSSKSDGARLMEIKCASVGASGSPNSSTFIKRQKGQPTPRFSSNSALNSFSSSTNDILILEAFRGTKTCSIKEVPMTVQYDSDQDIGLRHEAHMAEVLRRACERKEAHQYRRVLKSKVNYNQSHGAIDQALKRVDSLGRLEHFCLTPLLFSTSWRSKLAPVRDHTIESSRVDNHYNIPSAVNDPVTPITPELLSPGGNQTNIFQQEADERWHQVVCINYIKEYEQYIQTLGFNSVQNRYLPKGSTIVQTNPAGKSGSKKSRFRQPPAGANSPSSYTSTTKSGKSRDLMAPVQLRKGSISTSNASLPNASSNVYDTGYLIKFLNGGCLVFKVGFCKPYVYSILYSIEGERFNNSNVKLNMTAFLDELDNIKVTMHLHSFTYDYHLRSVYSYISGRQLTFNPGYHLISFLDDFRKYYQKAPNYARNHIVCGEINVTNIKVSAQQLYSYIVTHNSVYNMEALEMSTLANSFSNLSYRNFMDDQKNEVTSLKEGFQDSKLSRIHANDYVLIELKREKIHYMDGKDPDIFDCGLLITHEVASTATSKNCITLKYFLLLTNQRDLYPRLIHTYDSIISLGFHRPIRLGISQQKPARPVIRKVSSATALSSGQSDPEDIQSSELQSSGEMSGPQSMISNANSVHSSSSGLQFGAGSSVCENKLPAVVIEKPAKSGNKAVSSAENMKLDDLEESTPSSGSRRARNEPSRSDLETPRLSSASHNEQLSQVESYSEDYTLVGDVSPTSKRKRNYSTSSSQKNCNGPAAQERTICDEEITYLGYFSSDEMDMLKFLQEKTANLRAHIEDVVRQAEVHYRRDYLWHKLMQRTTTLSTKSEEIPLTIEELWQLLNTVESIDLASLDFQLSVFTSMSPSWYMKLLRAFNDLRQSSMNQHRIYAVKTTRTLLLYIDPKCTTAFILFSVDPDRGSAELNIMLKDKQECSKTPTKSAANEHNSSKLTNNIELDQDCQQLINDFVNFTASFMWSSFLS